MTRKEELNRFWPKGVQPNRPIHTKTRVRYYYMNDSSLMYFIITMQYPPLMINGKEMKDNDVFCPMCNDWHENNTLCQMSMEGGL